MQPKGESTWLKSSLIWLSKIDWNRSTLLDKLKTAHSIFNHVCRASRKLDSTFSTETLLVLICCFVLLTSCLLFLICDVSSSSGNIFGIDIRFAELIACLVVCVGVLVLLISVDLPVSQVGHILIKNSLMQSTDALFDIAGRQASRSGHGSLRSNSRSHWETRGNLPHRAWPDQLFIQINEWSIDNVVLGYTKRYSAADIGCWLFHYWNGPVSQCNVVLLIYSNASNDSLSSAVNESWLCITVHLVCGNVLDHTAAGDSRKRRQHFHQYDSFIAQPWCLKRQSIDRWYSSVVGAHL